VNLAVVLEAQVLRVVVDIAIDRDRGAVELSLELWKTRVD
jgi:hypothetical protein